MGVIKQTFIYVDRNWKKSALLFVLMFVIIHLLLASVLILRVTHMTMENLFTQSPNQFAFQLAPDVQADSQAVTLETMEKIRALPYVRNVRFSVSAFLQNSTGLLPYHSESDFLPMRCPERNVCHFLAEGVSEPLFLELEEGRIILTQGRTFTEEELEYGSNLALISQDFAALNDLMIGDSLPMETRIYHPNMWEGNLLDQPNYLVHLEPIELTIIGLFEPGWSVSQELEPLLQSEMNMTFFTPNNFVASMNAIILNLNHYYFTSEELALIPPSVLFQQSGTIRAGMISLHDFRDADAFWEYARMLIPESYTVMSPEMMGIMGAASSMETIQEIVSRFLYGALAACVIIIGLTGMLFCVDRRKELGIYLALGRSKGQILLQLFLENLWIVLPIALLSFFTGNWLASRLNSWLMQNYLEINATVPPRHLWTITNTVTYERVLGLQQITLDLPTFFIMWGIAILAILLGIIIPTFYLIRLNPKKILMSGEIR